MKEVIAITNDKGGVGKTTTAHNLAMGLCLKGFKVLEIDLDSQRNASTLCGWSAPKGDTRRTIADALKDGSKLPVYKTDKGLYYTPSSIAMVDIDPYLRANMASCLVLKNIFSQPLDNNFEDESINTINDFDYVVIDCPPSLGPITLNAMCVATGLIIPAQLEAFSVRGLGNVIAKFKEVQANFNQQLTIRGLLFVMTDARPLITQAYKENLRETFTDLVFNSMIRRNIKIVESQDDEGDIFNYDPSSNGAKDYSAFVTEFLETSPINA